MVLPGVALASAALGLSLLRHQGEDSGLNPVLSPTSASIGLGMCLGGADGTTRDEMLSVLYPELRETEVHRGFGDFISSLNANADANTTLDVVNRIFLASDYELRPAFRSLCAENYQSPVEEVDFVQAAEAARATINDWVEAQTNGKIQDLIPKDSLDSSTRLVLVNAVYFKADWVKPFEKSYNGTFLVAPGESIRVKMMRKSREAFPHAEDDSVQVLRLDYKGEDGLALFVFVPKERFGLDAWLETVNGTELSRLMAACRSDVPLDVRLPKWKAESSMSLVRALKEMGMRAAFNNGANFSRIADESLHISDVMHKAFVEVDESGSEAAAATGISMVYKSAMIMPEINANRPFMYAIAKADAGGAYNILFQGLMRRPKEVEA